MEFLLETKNITMQFGGLKAINDVSMQIKKGNIHALIGPNGAGKTTFFNIVSGIYVPTNGHIIFNGEDITARKAYQISKLGIARTFQNIQLFENLSALENVMVGRHTRTNESVLETILHTKRMKNEEYRCLSKSKKVLEFVGLGLEIHTLASALPYGKKRILEIARALATDPQIIMLDEPCAGMNESETNDLMQTVYKIRDSGITVLLVEHDMKFVMDISDTITVLDYGQKISEGDPHYIKNDPAVIDAYLGKEGEA